jgi:predicted phosphoribosyltransferase
MGTVKPYSNRTQAGKQLALALRHYARDPAAIVLALPRGGVPVGFAVAQALGLALDILLVRKLGMPGQEEYAFGAVAIGGIRVLQREVLREAGITPETLEAMCARQMAELAEREHRYRGTRPPPDLAGHTAILVDDGLATGATMLAAIALANAGNPARTVVAVPVGAPDTCAELESEVDELVCPLRPPMFRAVGKWYRQFDQTTDQEVIDLLTRAWHEQEPHRGAIHP